MTTQELKERVMQHGKTNVLEKDGTIHVSPILALVEDIKFLNELRRKAQVLDMHSEIAKVIASNCDKTKNQIFKVQKFFDDYDEILSGKQYDPVNHWVAQLLSEKESEKLILWLEEQADKIKELKEQLKDDVVVHKIIGNEYDGDALDETARMFILRYDPNIDLTNTSGANDYNIIITENDNVASVLRKSSSNIQDMMDEYFGVDENDKVKRVIISHQQKIDDNQAYCMIICHGYESENDGEVEALLENQFSHAVDAKVRLEWNAKAYPVTVATLKKELDLETYRKEKDKVFENETIIHVDKSKTSSDVVLHDYEPTRSKESNFDCDMF